MQRASWLVATVALAACGLDVVGIAPGGVTPTGEGGSPSGGNSTSGSTSSGSASGSSGTPEGDAAVDAPYVPSIDAGAAEVVIDGLPNLTAITIVGNRLAVARSDAEAVTIDVTNGKKGTIPSVKKAVALVADPDDVFFVAVLDADSGNVGHYRGDGTANGVTHSNEPPGRDVFLEGALLFGSYKDHVVSYTANDIGNIQDRSDKSGTPMGVVATPNDVYWSDDARGTVFKDSRIVTGDPTKVIDMLDHPGSLTLLGVALYVATSTAIMRVTSPVETTASGLSKPMALTHDVLTLYWIDATAGLLKRKATVGADQDVQTIGTLQPFAEFRPKLIDFKDEYVYWGSPNEGRVYRRKK